MRYLIVMVVSLGLWSWSCVSSGGSGLHPLLGVSDGGGKEDGGTGCGPTKTCPSDSSKTYQLCTTKKTATCSESEYRLSDGKTFACPSCGSCADATEDVMAWCAGGAAPADFSEPP